LESELEARARSEREQLETYTGVHGLYSSWQDQESRLSLPTCSFLTDELRRMANIARVGTVASTMVLGAALLVCVGAATSKRNTPRMCGPR